MGLNVVVLFSLGTLFFSRSTNCLLTFALDMLQREDKARNEALLLKWDEVLWDMLKWMEFYKVMGVILNLRYEKGLCLKLVGEM